MSVAPKSSEGPVYTDAGVQPRTSPRDLAVRDLLLIAAVESSDDAIVTKTLDGIITSWNPGAERLFGYSAAEVVGEHINIVVPEDLRDEVRGILSKVRNGEKIEHHETARCTKDGRRIHISLSVSPVKSATGKVIGAAKVARDITESRKIHETLRESEQMARDIIDGALDGFIQVSDGGVVTEWNPRAEQIFGWMRDEACGRTLADLKMPAPYLSCFEEMSARLRRNFGEGGGERAEIEALRKDGVTIKLEIALTALRRRDGYVFNGFVRDLTEKLAIEEHLRQAQKMESIGQLTGGIAHDFNNMLTVITGTIDILAEAVGDKPELVAIANLIGQAADRGAELTRHLLAFARKQPLQPREVALNTILAESEKLLRPALGERVDIVLAMDDDAWPALIDPTQLTAALFNLAVNARDAMPDGGKLTIETGNVVLDEDYVKTEPDVTAGHYAMIAVSDTGVGIPRHLREKIFEPFFTTKQVGSGTGLGLSMVYGFVKQSGGHIKVYSETGVGTTFKLYLPRAATVPQQDFALDARPEGGAETIFVVEDDVLVLGSVTTQLRSLGYKTLSAANGAEALELVRSGAAFDLLFTDVIMPGKLNGRQLADEIAKLRSPLKVLFTSGYTKSAITHHGRLDAGVLLLAKPYRIQELARMVRRALETSTSAPAYRAAAQTQVA